MATSEDTATSIGGMDDSLPGDSTSGGRTRGGAEIRKVKNLLVTDFPNITGVMSSSHTELNVLDGVTAGTLKASAAVVVSAASKIDVWDATSLKIGGTAISSSATELNVLDGISATLAHTDLDYTEVTTPGTAEASKCLVADSNIDIGTIRNLSATEVDGTTVKENGTALASVYAKILSPSLATPTLEAATLNTSVGGTAVLDEDNMASDSATKIATQQSIKAYVDAAIAGVQAVKRIQTDYEDIGIHDWSSDAGEDAIYYDVTLDNVVVAANCTVQLMGHPGLADGNDYLTGRITSTTNLRISLPEFGSGPITRLRWYVVEYN